MTLVVLDDLALLLEVEDEDVEDSSSDRYAVSIRMVILRIVKAGGLPFKVMGKVDLVAGLMWAKDYLH